MNKQRVSKKKKPMMLRMKMKMVMKILIAVLRLLDELCNFRTYFVWAMP